MGTAAIQGELWGQAVQDRALIQEPMHRPLFDAMLDAAQITAGTRILNAGCGGGGSCVLAAERGAQVSALDAAPEMIAFARERVPGGDFRVGDIESLIPPFSSDAYAANTRKGRRAVFTPYHVSITVEGARITLI